MKRARYAKLSIDQIMKDRPNIVLLVFDQLRYDCLGHVGAFPVKTPNIDKLAQSSVVFTKAYSPSPVCGPSRTCLFAGKRAENFGAYWNQSAMKVQSLRPNTFFSWLTALNEAGYSTGHFGKWDVNPIYSATDFGYEKHISHAKKVSQMAEQHAVNGFFGTVEYGKYEDSVAYWETDKTIELIQQFAKKGEPYFVHSEFVEPHPPCVPNTLFMRKYDDVTIPQWGSMSESFEGKPYIQEQQLYSWRIEKYTWREWEPIVRRYYAMISQIDDCVGRIMAAIEETGKADETMVIITSDHGDMCGSHHMMDKHYVMYEDIVHVPLIIHYPKMIGRRIINDRYVCNMLDIAATLMDVTDNYVGNESNTHGVSLLPLLGDVSQHKKLDYAVMTYNGQQFGLYSQRCIRTDDWKYVWNGTDLDELYDMKNDPWELHNCINDGHDEVVATLRKTLYEHLVAQNDELMMTDWVRCQFLENRKLSIRADSV